MISMENLKLITAKNTWLIPQLAKEESSTKPQVIVKIFRKEFNPLHTFSCIETS